MSAPVERNFGDVSKVTLISKYRTEELSKCRRTQQSSFDCKILRRRTGKGGKYEQDGSGGSVVFAQNREIFSFPSVDDAICSPLRTEFIFTCPKRSDRNLKKCKEYALLNITLSR